MVLLTIVAVAASVMQKIVKSNLPNPGGKLVVIRKNPHANAVGLELDIRHNYWYITWTPISTTAILEI
jgi:biopolymer transport protein ExbD